MKVSADLPDAVVKTPNASPNIVTKALVIFISKRPLRPAIPVLPPGSAPRARLRPARAPGPPTRYLITPAYRTWHRLTRLGNLRHLRPLGRWRARRPGLS